jgi:hypothetical protein
MYFYLEKAIEIIRMLRAPLASHGERFDELLRLYYESDGDPDEVPTRLSQEVGKTNRERREFSSFLKREYRGAIDAYLENLADQARGK